MLGVEFGRVVDVCSRYVRFEVDSTREPSPTPAQQAPTHPTAWERQRVVYAALVLVGTGGAWILGCNSLWRWGGEVGSMRWPWPWITTW